MKAVVCTIPLLVWLALISNGMATPETFRPSTSRSATDLSRAPLACTSITPLSLGFGDVLVGESTVDTLTISNPGAAAIDVSSVTTSGTNAALFAVDTTPFTVPSLESRTLAVRFSPDRVGTYTASLDLVCDSESVSIPLSGAGVPLLVVVTPLNAPTAGDSLSLSATLPDTYVPDTQEIFFRRTGEANYQSLPVTRAGTRLSATIPPQAVTPRGLDYYFRFSRGPNTLTVPGTNPESNPIRLRVQVERLVAKIDLPSLQYRMISVPIELDDGSIDSVLTDDFSAYDSTQWRLFRWSPTIQAYAEPPELLDTFVPGAAFWINTRSGKTFDVESGQSVDARSTYPVTLHPGWNQIGTPYAFAVAWASVAGSEMVEALVSYDGREYQYGETVLEPWQGYFVFNPTSEEIELSFVPMETAESAPKHASRSPHALRDGYGVQLLGTVEGTQWVDTQNFLGLVEGASSGLDYLDVTEPPGIGEHLRVSILEQNRRMAASYRAVSADGRKWRVQVTMEGMRTPLRQHQQVHFDVEPWGTWPAGHTLEVWDEQLGKLHTATSGEFAVSVTPDEPRHLHVIIGTADYAAEQREGISPAKPRLSQNYPNPFSASTRIEYLLSGPSRVVVAVYDVLGRRVRTLVKSKREAGRYEVMWDGRDETGAAVASGVYVCRMESGDTRLARTMVVLR